MLIIYNAVNILAVVDQVIQELLAAVIVNAGKDRGQRRRPALHGETRVVLRLGTQVTTRIA